MRIKLCAIAKNENPYFDEWLNHHRKVGISHFTIYDNNSQVPIKEYFQKNNIKSDDVEIIEWPDSKLGSQSRAYLDCCERYKNKEFEYIGFLDIDEFYMSNRMNIVSDIAYLTLKYGNFQGLGLYWRIYGSNDPYFEVRHPIEEYIKWHGDKHIKSFINPNFVKVFPDPHKAVLKEGKYINERGGDVISPIGTHTSDEIWIKHVFTRSRTEFQEKILRGDANLQKQTRKMEDFFFYNDKCIETK